MRGLSQSTSFFSPIFYCTTLTDKFKRNSFNPNFPTSFLDTHCFTCLDGAKLEMKVFCQINTEAIPSPKKRRRNLNLAYFTKCERHFDIWPLEITVKLVRVGKVGRLKSVFMCISIIKKRKVVTKNISYLI